MAIFFLISIGNAQPVRPSIVLSQIEMTPSGGQPYDEFYWLNSNNAALIKTGAKILTTGSYRLDISAYSTAGTPIVNLLIDGTLKGHITVNTIKTNIFSLIISSIPSGAHTIKLQLSNFNSGNNHVRIGLIYFTQTLLSTPYTYPAISPLALIKGKFLQANHFGSGKLRGFNLDENGTNQTNANGGSVQSMIDMKATGANIARCFVSVTRSLNSNVYQLKPDALQKLDTTIQRAARLGFYVVPCLYLDPEFNGGQGNADLWGPTSLGPNQGVAVDFVQRRNSVIAIWKFLANRYKSNTWVGAYDLWNEPRSLFNYALYLRWQQQIIDSIRVIDPNHVIAIECIENDMFAMMLPFQNSNIIYSPHGYSPLKITHQGFEGTVRNKYPTLASTSDLKAPFGKTELSKQHDDVRTMSHRFHVPIFIGEFSCVNWAPINDAGKWTSTEWVNDNISLLETEKWSWVYHSWREWTPWESEISSQWYIDNHVTFKNGYPSSLPPINARTSKAPTIVMLKKWFRLNDSTAIIRNIAPTVRITSPVSNATFATPASITIAANAADSDGTIAKVEFYYGSTLRHTEYVFPYSYVWHNVAAGNYTITAKAYDNAGAYTVSSPVVFTVSTLNVAPTVVIKSPVDKATFDAPASIKIIADAADTDGNISKVEFYNGTTLITTEKYAPYSWSWQNVPAGNYKITAKAYDNSGTYSISKPVAIVVLAQNTRAIVDSISHREVVSPAISSSSITKSTTKVNASIPGINTSANEVEDQQKITAGNLETVVIKVVPNPASNTLSVFVRGIKKNEELKVSILSINGTLLQTVNSNRSSPIIHVDITPLKTGTYLVQAVLRDQIVYKQFVKL